ncbi:MAG: N-acetylmuramoyl-L-alanine amidase [Pseudomonadota bacterium]
MGAWQSWLATGTWTILLRLLAIVACLSVTLSNPHASERDEEPAIAFAARVVGDENRARLIVDFSRRINHDTFLLNKPDRLVVDLPETIFALDDDARKLPKTLVSKLRFGALGDGQSRISLDLSAPVAVKNSFLREVNNGARFRLIVDMVVSDAASFASAVRPPPKVEPLPETAQQEANQKKRRYKVLLDPGHGGIDGGALGRDRTREKDITLAFSKRLKGILEKEDQFQPLLTRSDDSFVPLTARLQMARDVQADLFISIHADSLNIRSIRGATVYTLSKEGSDSLSRVLAKKQNRADLVAGLELPKEEPEVADILIDMTRRETAVFSHRFASHLVLYMSKDLKMINNPLRSADFYVLKAPEVPSVLLELGYLSNSRDEELLRSQEWQEKAANRVAGAIRRFFADGHGQ